MISINLLSPQLKNKRADDKKKASLIGVCIIIVFSALILGIISKSLESTITTNLQTSRQDLQKSKDALSESGDIKDLALFINDRSKSVDKIEKDNVLWSSALRELANLVPSNIQFESLDCNQNKSPNFVLAGNAADERDIVSFKNKLEESSYFKNVNFNNASLATNQATKKFNFSLEFDKESSNQ